MRACAVKELCGKSIRQNAARLKCSIGCVGDNLEFKVACVLNDNATTSASCFFFNPFSCSTRLLPLKPSARTRVLFSLVFLGMSDYFLQNRQVSVTCLDCIPKIDHNSLIISGTLPLLTALRGFETQRFLSALCCDQVTQIVVSPSFSPRSLWTPRRWPAAQNCCMNQLTMGGLE